MEKIILTKKQANVIENFKDGFDNIMNGLTYDDFIKAVKDGYEVELEFKVGDWVTDRDESSNVTGRITRVDTVNKLVWGYFSYHDKETNFDFWEVRHATPSEIAQEKERRFFAGHGREPWELRLYDAVKRTTTKIPLFVVEISRDYPKNTTSYKLSDGSIQKKENMKELFEVLYFAEQRLDVKTNE